MLFKTHLTFGILLFLLLFATQSKWYVFLIGTIIGTVIVDIDSKKSKTGKHIIFRPIQILTKHRGIFHTPFAAIILTLIMTTINIEFAFAFLIGYSGHLLLDSFTKQGIKLFYPLSNKRIKSKIKTNGYFELILFSIITTTNLILIILIFYKYIF